MVSSRIRWERNPSNLQSTRPVTPRGGRSSSNSVVTMRSVSSSDGPKSVVMAEVVQVPVEMNLVTC